MGACTFITGRKAETAREAFDALRQEAEYDHGHSYTGTIAEKNSFIMLPTPADADDDDIYGKAMEACEDGSPPAAIILEAPFASMTETASGHYWFLPIRLIILDRFPSIDRIGKVTCPMLFFHGHRDWGVPFKQGKRLFDAAPAQARDGMAKRLVELPGAGHNDIRVLYPDLHSEELRRFIERIRTAPPRAPETLSE